MHTLLTPFLNYLVGEGFKSTVKQAYLQAIFFGIIGVSLFISLLFLCIIGFIMLCSVMKPLAAASIMFFIWLFIVGLSILASKVLKISRRSYQQRKLEEQHHKLVTDATLSGIFTLGKHLPFTKFGVAILGLTTYLLWKKDKKGHS
ncbi:hypothetical protein [Bartonella sp. B41]